MAQRTSDLRKTKDKWWPPVSRDKIRPTRVWRVGAQSTLPARTPGGTTCRTVLHWHRWYGKRLCQCMPENVTWRSARNEEHKPSSRMKDEE